MSLTDSARARALTAILTLAVLFFGFGPAAPSAKADPSCPDQAEKRSDLVSAQIQARATDCRVEVPSEEDAATKFYVEPDGSYSREIFSGPIQTQVIDQATQEPTWQPVDTTLSADASGWQPVNTIGSIHFSTASNAQLAVLSVGQTNANVEVANIPNCNPEVEDIYCIGFNKSWAGTTTSVPNPSGSSLTIPNVFPHTDLMLTAHPAGFDIQEILDTAPPSSPIYSYPFTLTAGLTPTVDMLGRFFVTDATGKKVFYADPPAMWGAAIDPNSGGDPTQVGAVATQVVATPTGWTLQVVPDPAFLANPLTVYPVTIDPAPNLGASTDTFVQSDAPGTSYWTNADLKAGSYDASTIARSYMKFDTATLGGKHVISAKLNLYNYWSSHCPSSQSSAQVTNVYRLTSGISTSTTWNNQPSINSTSVGASRFAYGWSASGSSSGSTPVGCERRYVPITVTDVVQDWADGTANHGVLVRSASESSSTSWRRFYSSDAGSLKPYLAVNYNSYPKVPASLSPGNSTFVNSLKPVLSAAVSDVDGGNVKLVVDLQKSDGTVIVTNASGSSVASGSVSKYTAPTLVDGVAYRWRTRAHDGTDYSKAYTPTTGYISFTVDVTKPVAPDVTSSAYPSGSWAGGAGQAGNFTFAPGVSTDVLGYYYGLDQPNPATYTASTSVSLTPATDGPHTLYVKAKDRAGNVSPITAYAFKVGAGAVTSPKAGDRTQKRVTLSAETQPTYTSVTYYWRRSDTDTWATIPTADVTYASSGSGIGSWPVSFSAGIPIPNVIWDAAATTSSTDGPLQVRAQFNAGSPTSSTNAKLDLNAFGGDYASAPIGPGSVNLLTGNFSIGATDVSIESPVTDIVLSRSFNSRSPGVTGPLGPGWVSSVEAAEAFSDYTKLHDATTFVTVTAVDGTLIAFAKTSTGYLSEVGFEDLALSLPSSGTFELKDPEGNITRFTKPTGATDYVPTTVIQPGSTNSTSFVFETVGGVSRIKKAVAPVPAGISSSTCATATPARGCRVLTFNYATLTTATGSGTDPGVWGSFAGRLDSVDFTAWNPQLGTPAMVTAAVARYLYDSPDGRLRAVWDPRISPALKTMYSYDTAGHVTTLTPPGELPWTFDYATIVGDSNTGRLRSVSRPALPPATGNATSTVVYGIPLSGSGAPYAMGVGDVAAWGQSDLPTDATAIFPPNQVPATPPTSYERATIHYIDNTGREVNAADPGGFISTTEYDAFGNVVRELSASNREASLAFGTTTGDHAARSSELDTHSVFSADGINLVDEFGPLHEVTLDDGTVVNARAHSHNVFDEGAPSGGPYHLLTTSTESAWVDGVDQDTQTTKYGYDPAAGTTSGWTLRQATSTTIDPLGLNLRTTTNYNADGLVTRTTLRGGQPTTTTYWVADGGGYVPECRNRPEWANLVCIVDPPNSSVGLAGPMAVGYSYTMLDQIDLKAEGARTTTYTYDAAGRLKKESISGSAGTALPATETAYDPATGRATSTFTTSGQTTTTITREYDGLGRLVRYTDADGNVATTGYDLLDRPISSTDGKGTQTFTYDAGSERRGLLTGLTDSAAGSFTATYDAEGNVVATGYPNGLVATSQYDETETLVSLAYEKITNCTSACEWLTFSVRSSIDDNWRSQTSQLSSQQYAYDSAGRLTLVKDTPANQGCQTRSYAFDANSNRTRLTLRNPAADASCDTTSPGSVQTHTYDNVDHLTDSGFVYDALGRITTVPGGPASGATTATYYMNDLVRSLTQNGVTRTWTLDPSARFRTWTDSGGTPVARTNHYAADSDAPAWIAEDATGNSWTRNVTGIGGDLAATATDSGAVTLQLANLHGDIVATASPSASVAAPLSTFESTEFGVPRTGNGRRFGWLGAKQRMTDSITGIVVMGVRLYLPQLGRFLQLDPIPGGSANPYDYADQDPLGKFDLDGRWARRFRKRGRWNQVGSDPFGEGLKLCQGMTPGHPYVNFAMAACKVAGYAYKGYKFLKSGGKWLPKILNFFRTPTKLCACPGHRRGSGAIMASYRHRHRPSRFSRGRFY